MLRLLIAGIALAVLCGCPKDECSPQVVTSDTPCSTTQDCIDENFQTLSCVSGVCRRPCLRDRDCELPMLDADDPCFAEVPPQKKAICEDQLCIDGCASNAECSGGQSCEAGRCVYFAESFEDEDRDGAVSLEALGWNGVPKELVNFRTVIAW